MPPSRTLEIFITCFIYTLLPVFVCAASIAQVEDDCPVSTEHCVCSEGPFYVIYCKNVTDNATLRDIVSNFTARTFVFELGALNWTSLPVAALESPYLMSIVINNSTFVRLFDNSNALSAHNISMIHHLSIENVTFTEAWSWCQLNFLKKLDILFAYNSTIGDTIPFNFSDCVSKSLKFLSISQSNVTEVESGSLKELKNLTYLRISHSKLKTLSRDILPSPSKLVQLKLDHNSIAALPDDMFENMPNLTVISLSNNMLSSLSEELCRPLWRPHVYLELRNNPLKCDCRMLWVVTSPEKPNIIGECASPKNLFGKSIMELTADDLEEC